ncbi:MAG: type 1 glutamine amidotransferase domain-containing protein, partial [Noviherbaspirillum sp.]
MTYPQQAFEQSGASTRIISNRHGKVQGFHHATRADRFDVDLDFDEADAEDFDAVLLPGGIMSADRLRDVSAARRFVQDMQREGKPIAVICHGSWLLVSAGLARDRTLTSWPSLRQDIANAGGCWVNQEVIQDGNLVSSRMAADLPAFTRKAMEVMAQRVRIGVRGTADERMAVGATG